MARTLWIIFPEELTIMAKANIARQQGDNFQARIFWLKASALLDPDSPVVKVAYETGPKGFDDIQIVYAPDVAEKDYRGEPILRRYIQCKYHTTAGQFGYEDLTDKTFINASRYSLLERAYMVQTEHAPDGVGCRFELMTNWRFKPKDPLMRLIRKSAGEIDLNTLFDDTTDVSRMGKVRKTWCEHLGIDHAALEHLARVFTINEQPDSLEGLKQQLDDRFAAVGMKRISASESGYIYDDLVTKLLAQGRIEFDRDSFREMCQGEGLMEHKTKQKSIPPIGIRSFMHQIDNLEDRCKKLLDLVPYFDGRYIRDEADWGKLMPLMRSFLLEEARISDNLRLILDIHSSLAFAVGTVLNVKCGKHIEIEQRFGGRHLWSMDDQQLQESWPEFVLAEKVVGNDGNEVAVAIGLTHEISENVQKYVESKLDRTGRILSFSPKGDPSQQSVICGRHAFSLAEKVVRRLRELRNEETPIDKVHIFIAGPNAFTFFLGQQQQAIGSCSVYEYDFEGGKGGGYSLGISL